MTGLAVDSRQVKPGYLFAALPGSKVHGGEFIDYALRMGAGAILTDAEGVGIAGAMPGAGGDPSRPEAGACPCRARPGSGHSPNAWSR